MHQNEAGWITVPILKSWFTTRVLNIKPHDGEVIIVVWDRCPVHCSSEMEKFLREEEIKFNDNNKNSRIFFKFIPAGCTPYL